MKNKNKIGVLLGLIGLMSVLLAQAQSAFTADGLVESTAGGFKFPDGSVQKTSAITGGPYVIGGTGPAGGFVFHLTDDGLHGLEAAPEDQTNGIVWGCWSLNNPTSIGARAWGLGEGARNTADIARGCDEDSIAAALADRYLSPSGYFDWYLPSRYELDLMYREIGQGASPPNENVGGFVSGYYWSSSEYSGKDAWVQYFNSGLQAVVAKNNSLGKVRAIRAF